MITLGCFSIRDATSEFLDLVLCTVKYFRATSLENVLNAEFTRSIYMVDLRKTKKLYS